MIKSYPKIYHLGHPAIEELLLDSVLVQEKIDGSQFSFGVIDNVLYCRSKGTQIDLDAPDKLFLKAIETVHNLHEAGVLPNNVIFRGEYLQSAKNNTLTYHRVPRNHIMIYDIQRILTNFIEGFSYYSFLPWREVQLMSQDIGLETVPVLQIPKFTIEDLDAALNRESVLRGCKVEGIVIKNYSRYGKDGHPLFGKYVSEAFKEVHKSNKTFNPASKSDIISRLGDTYGTEARWLKAIHYLRDSGELSDSPKDIGLIINRIQTDIIEEEYDSICEELWKEYKGRVMKATVRGVPEYYKQYLANKQFR